MPRLELKPRTVEMPEGVTISQDAGKITLKGEVLV